MDTTFAPPVFKCAIACSTSALPTPAPTAVGRDCQEVDLAVTLSGPEDPADESHDPFVDFGDGGIPTVFRGMQTGEVATVVLSPVTVPVGEDDVTDERAERVLVERFESVDRQLEKDREVLGCERTDVHGGSLSAESVKREPSFRMRWLHSRPEGPLSDADPVRCETLHARIVEEGGAAGTAVGRARFG
jgi:hypothetical protein